MGDKNISLVERVYTVSELQQIITRSVEQAISNYLESFLLSVEGILGEIKDNGYSICYGVPLRDVDGNSISLDIPRGLVDATYSNRKVTVTGTLRCKFWRNTPNIRIDVAGIRLHSEVDPELLEQEKILVEVVKSHKDYSKTFPVKESYTVALIHPSTGDVKNDFLRQLSGVENITVNTYPVNIFSFEEIKQAVEESSGDIVVIIRGGGDDAGFEVFNQRELLEVWGSKDAYRISALGHTSQRFLLDLFSDASCDTPTAAGVFIRRHIETVEMEKKYGEIEKNYKNLVNQLNEEQKKYREEVALIQKKHSEEMAAVQKKYSEDMTAIQKKHSEDLATIQKKYLEERTSLVKTMQEEKTRKDEELSKYVKELMKVKEQQAEEQKKYAEELSRVEKAASLIEEKYAKKLLTYRGALVIQTVIVLLALAYVIFGK